MGLSALRRLRLPGAGWIGAGLLAAVSFWAGHNFDRWTGQAPPATGTTAVAHATRPHDRPHGWVAARIAALEPGTVYVRRGGSVVRDAPKPSASVLKHENKGAAVTLLEKTDDGWARIKDGKLTGWMRASVLGPQAP